MIIKSIKVKNFRQFRESRTIEFSTSKDENITLILGDNTSGKTTLLQAFLWCLYGQANFKRKDMLLNTITSQNMLVSKNDEEINVALELMHHGVNYYITRSLKYTVRNSEIKASSVSIVDMSYKQEDGQHQPIPTYEIKKKIQEILPENLSHYFLYDTERFGNITNKTDVADAVKGILGLTVLENAIEHFGRDTLKGSLLGKFNASLNLTGNKAAASALEKMQKAAEKKEALNDRKKENTKELEHFKTQKKHIEQTLRELEPSAKLQLKRDENKRGLVYEEKELISQTHSFLSNFRNNTFMYLARPLMKKALYELKNANLDDKGIEGMNANSIRDIIGRGKCVCGATIVEGNEAHDHLLHELNYLPPESIGSLIKSFKEKTEIMLNSNPNFMNNLDDSYKQFKQTKRRIGELNAEIEAITEQLKEKESVKKHQETLLNTEQRIQRIENLLLGLEKQIWEQERIIEENQKIRNENLSASEKNDEILEYMAYAEAVRDWLVNRYTLREREIKDTLEERVNYYFSRIYHGNRKVKVDDRYNVTLITTSADQELITDESQGLETVKNFAFISGLVDMAKEKLQEEINSNEKDPEDYPLILDAPFSNADELHVENISKVLPEVSSQLILIVMAKDWNYAEQSMGVKVGKRYYLNKKSEVLSEIIEVD